MLLPKRVLYPYVVSPKGAYDDLGISIYENKDYVKILIPANLLKSPCAETTDQEELFCWVKNEFTELGEKDHIVIVIPQPRECALSEVLADDIECDVSKLII